MRNLNIVKEAISPSPVVARPHGEGEDDGALLSVGSARDDESSVLAVIDARTMAAVARATVPSAIPLGFHGSFVH